MKTYIVLEKDNQKVAVGRKNFLNILETLEEEEKGLRELRKMSNHVDKISYEGQLEEGKGGYLKLLYEEDRDFKEETYRLKVDQYTLYIISAFWESGITSTSK